MNYFSSQFSAKLSDNDRLFLKKINEWVNKSQNTYVLKFSNFLDRRQMQLCEDMFCFLGFHNFMFYGGYEKAQRCILAIYPEYYEIDKNSFPVRSLCFDYRKEDKLSHRDFLGSLMSLQIKREMVGDIVVDEGHTTVFISDRLSSLVCDSIRKVGSVGVSVTECCDNLDKLDNNISFESINGTVSSLRLDCIISLFTRLSREKSSALIKSGNVSLNYNEADNISAMISPGDTISVKGYGKFIFAQNNGMTKKGRMNIEIKKYI